MAEDEAAMFVGPDRRKSRPRASVATIANSVIIVSTLIGGGISTLLFLSDLKGDVRIVQDKTVRVERSIDNLTGRFDAWVASNARGQQGR